MLMHINTLQNRKFHLIYIELLKIYVLHTKLFIKFTCLYVKYALHLLRN